MGSIGHAVSDSSDGRARTLGHARIALLEARRESELASLVRRHGGEPVAVPALREVERECALEVEQAALVLGRATERSPIVVLATGAGLERWLALAQGDDRRREALRQGLLQSTIVCRGPKPVAVLKREGLPVHVRAEPPHTTTELLAALLGMDVEGRDAIYVHDGGALRTVPEALARRGARVLELQPYEWALPADLEPLRGLVRTIVAGEVDALAITTQVQAKHLFEVAASMGLRDALREVLGGRVVVAAVGPTCERALRELGAPPHVVPAQAKMGPLVLALAERLNRGDASATP
jgi:uroporphyrinogen-III synthase